jgi:hypothetical protein
MDAFQSQLTPKHEEIRAAKLDDIIAAKIIDMPRPQIGDGKASGRSLLDTPIVILRRQPFSLLSFPSNLRNEADCLARHPLERGFVQRLILRLSTGIR